MRIILDMAPSRTISVSRPTPADAVTLTVRHNAPGKPLVEVEVPLYRADLVALIRALQAIE